MHAITEHPTDISHERQARNSLDELLGCVLRMPWLPQHAAESVGEVESERDAGLHHFGFNTLIPQIL